MKRIALVTLVTCGFILSGCGSNNYVDPTAGDGMGGDSFAPSVGFLNYTRDINITDYSKYSIDFQYADENGFVVEGQKVCIKAFDKHYGSVASRYGGSQSIPSQISSQCTITDSDGIGKFIYTPPAVMPSEGTTYNLSMITTGENNTTSSAPVTLHFHPLASSISATATTLSIVYGYRPPRENGNGDVHEQDQFDREGSKVVNYYAVHAINEDSQAPVAGMPIKMILVNGIKELNSKKVQYENGVFKDTNPVTFIDDSIDYLENHYDSEKVQKNDNLIILPSKGKVDSSYLGGWKIDNVTSHELTLNGYFDNLTTESDLNYIIGNEKRLLSRDIVVAEVRTIDMEAITDENGMAYFKVVFDPELALHTVTLAAYAVTPQNERVGISRIVSLRVEDKVVPKQTMTINNIGGQQNVTIPLSMSFPSGSEHIFDLDIVPSSFSIAPTSHCAIINGNYNTGDSGAVSLVVATDGNISDTGGVDQCTITWQGGAGSVYFEY